MGLSNRGSSRRSRPGKGVLLLLLAVCAAGAGVWYFFFKDSKGANEEARELLGARDVIDRAPAANGDARTSAAGWDFADAAAQKAAASLRTGTGAERHTAVVANYNELAKMLENPLPPEARGRVLPVFHEITQELFFSNIRNEYSEDYIVKPGDSVQKIAKRFGVSEDLICIWNNIPEERKSRISQGASFKIVKGKPRIVVDKSDFCLSYYLGDNLARQFIVAHGKGNGTPEGATKVNSKEVDPDLLPRASTLQQEMDERWIGLSPIGQRNGIGIHGTKFENTIPGETSHGCVRMFNADVVELYRWTPMGADVEIRA